MSSLTRVRASKLAISRVPSFLVSPSRQMTTISRSRFLNSSPLSRRSTISSRSLNPSTFSRNFDSNFNLRMARYMHVRTISFSTIPRVAFRAFRVPAYATAAAGGALAYANYKVDEFRGFLGEAYSRASNSAAETFGALSSNASEAMEAARAQWQAASEGISSIETPEFFQSLWKRLEDGKDGISAKINSIGESMNKTSSSSGEEEGGGGGAGGGGNGNGIGGAALAAALAGNVTDSNGEERKPIDSSEELMVLTRKLIEVRNILKSIDKEPDSHSLTLPSIVVIGSQSSGKSSVLEAIVGHEFLPKGNNMVTRRPIELTLIHTEASSNNKRKGEVVEYAEFPGMGIGRMTDFRQVQKTLYDLNMAVPASECVSEVPIELKIHSPHVPDLTLIDLPGYVQISGLDQPEELREKISDLCEKYIAEPNIILAVCSADVDLANSPALRASRKVDPLGLRTIGVVTKMDLVEPQIGNNILMNNKYPLALGYIGVVCKNKLGMFSSGKGHDSSSGDGNLSSSVMKQEHDYFAANKEFFKAPVRGVNAGKEPLVGTDTLRRRLMSVLEESMGSSLHGIANAVQVELEEAGYQFKVQYNDRSITAESYVAETMDALKLRFSEFANSFGKPQVRQLLKQSLDEKVLDIMAQLYWSDDRVKELTKLGEDKKITEEDLDRYWKYKLDVSASSLTKSGIGRLSTQIVVDEIRKQIENLAKTEPFNHHPEASERIIGFSTAILRDRFGLTSDQVENCVKPFKYEVEVEPAEWENSRIKSLMLLERELKMCNEAFDQINKIVGKKRLNSAIGYVNSLEERERRKSLERQRLREIQQNENSNDSSDSQQSQPPPTPVEEDPTLPDYNSALLSKARDAKFLLARSEVLKARAQTLKSKRCKLGPESKAFCPEAFLNVVSDKLTYTAVMFINIELLSEFFYQFPREIDSRLVYDLDKNELSRFARENPAIKKHLDLQERKEKLEMVMEKLDSLVKLYNEKQSPRRNNSSSNKWGFF